jgi:signal transduction histidine kinase
MSSGSCADGSKRVVRSARFWTSHRQLQPDGLRASGWSEVTVDAPRAVQARLDLLRIEHVLSNLIDNAFEFSPTYSPVEVTLRLARPGLAAVGVRNQTPDGLGFGLYSSQRIVEQPGGRLTADYPHDGGARFVAELPTLETSIPQYRASEDDEDGGP